MYKPIKIIILFRKKHMKSFYTVPFQLQNKQNINFCN